MATVRIGSKSYMYIDRPLPLLGHIAIGIVDRGINLLQVRPTTLCPLSCIFCSVDAGPRSRNRLTEYMVNVDHLVAWICDAVRFKGGDTQIHIDSVGDPLVYPKIVDLVRKVRRIPGVSVISMETHGSALTERVAEMLDDAGLDRLNLSIDSLDPELARYLAGTKWFNIERVKRVAEYIASSLRMDLLIAPVWVPGINDAEMPKIIEFALRIGAGKKWPPLGIQKYEAHKYGRKPRGVKPMSWAEFYKSLRRWEQEFGVKLVLRPEDFGIKPARRLPIVFQRFERVGVRIVAPGWLKNQWLGVARNRLVTVVGVKTNPPVGYTIPVRILRTKDGIYVAEPV